MELKTPRLVCVAIIVVFTPLTAFAVFAAMQPDTVARLVGGFFVCFFALVHVTALYRFIHNKPYVVINDEGIEDVRLKIGIIRWGDVHSLEVRKLKGLPHICIDLHVPEKFYSKLPAWKQRILRSRDPRDPSILSINIGNLQPSSNEVMQYFILRHPELYREADRS